MVTSVRRSDRNELSRAAALFARSGGRDELAATLIDELGEGGIAAAHRQARGELARGRSRHLRDLLRLLDALEDAQDLSGSSPC